MPTSPLRVVWGYRDQPPSSRRAPIAEATGAHRMGSDAGSSRCSATDSSGLWPRLAYESSSQSVASGSRICIARQWTCGPMGCSTCCSVPASIEPHHPFVASRGPHLSCARLSGDPHHSMHRCPKYFSIASPRSELSALLAGVCAIDCYYNWCRQQLFWREMASVLVALVCLAAPWCQP